MINGFGIFTPKFAGNSRTSILTLVFVLSSAVPWSGCWRDRAADRHTKGERFQQERMTQDENSDPSQLLLPGAKLLNPKT